MQKKHLIGYPIVTLLAVVAGAASAGSTPTATTASSAPTVTATAAPATVTETAQTVTVTAGPDAAAAPSAPATAAAVPGDGTYEVGVDIQPGKYASGTPASGNCYWARLNSDDPFDGIIANNNSSGSSVVVIKKSDKYFQTSGCSDWTRR